MTRGIDHIGMTVPSIEEATRFFKAAFEAQVSYDVQRPEQQPMEGEEVEQQLDLPSGRKIVHMRLLRLGNGPSIELFELAASPNQPAVGIADMGLHHFALYVDDIEEASERIQQAGGSLLSEPHPLAGVEDGEGNRGVYGKTPWGSLVELIVYPSGIDYPKDSEATRWTPDQSN